MKKTFMIMAAMLLMSVSAFAQSGETPLKGDVNEDGVVDVSDITAVIGIIKNVQEHYFYLGTVKPTAENYKIIPGATTSHTSFDEAAGTTISVDAGQTVYMLCPAQWVKGKTVVLEDNSGETLNFSEEIDYTTVSGYAIYKTQVLTDAKDVTIKGPEITYYWYIGTTDPSTMNSIEPIVTDMSSPGWREIGTTKPTSLTYTSSNMLWNGVNNEIEFSRNYHYVALPSSSIKIWNGLGGEETSDSYETSVTKTINGVTYYIYKSLTKTVGFGYNIY